MAMPQPPNGLPTKRPSVARSEGARSGEAAHMRRPSQHEDKRRYLVDVGAVHIIDALVADLVKQAPTKATVVSTMREFLKKIEMRDVGALKPHQQAKYLIEAAEKGDNEALEGMIKSGADVKASAGDHRTALHAAAEAGFIECATLLLKAGADINAADKWYDHALDYAANAHKDDMVKFLESKGAVRGRKNDNNVAACVGGDDADQLIACVRLCALAQKGDVEGLRKFMDTTGVKPNIADYDLRTPMHVAAEEGHSEVVELLAERGADVNAKDRWGSTPLRGAIDHGKHDTADLIRSLGAEDAALVRRSSALDSLHEAGQKTSLYAACARGDITLVNKLIAEGADVNEVDYDMRAPLHLAAEEGHLDIVEKLIEHGADFNVKDRWGTTPLIGSQKNSHNDVVAYLLDAGAHVDRLELQAPTVDFGQLTDEWFEATARFAKLPGSSQVVPTVAIMARLQQEYGFNLAMHKVLMKELAFLSRARDDPHVITQMEDSSWEEIDEAVTKLPLKDAPVDKLPAKDMVVLHDDWVFNIMGRNTEQDALALTMLQTVAFNKLRVPNWREFVQSVSKLFDEVQNTENDGQNAQYIPELRDADSSPFALSICTAEGQEVHFGPHSSTFSVQSTGKTFAYTMALERHGADYVHTYVGQEPSGRAFNDFALTRKGNPFNPVTNAGAIVTSSMLDEKVDDLDERLKGYKGFVSRMSGDMDVGDCMDVYHSEQGCAYNNYALANFMRAQNTFPSHVDNHTDIAKNVNFYLRVCSTRVSTELLSRVASTYANHGVCPHTNTRCMNVTDVKQTLSILYSCGMYDFSGEWACTIGMPAKSGVSGNIFIVVPNVLGLCVWSPKLDEIGNSVRGIRLAKRFSEKFRFSLLEQLMRVA